MKGQFTLDLARKWWPIMTAGSILRLRRAHVAQARRGVDPSRVVELQITRPYRVRVTVRVHGTDIDSVREVFKDRVYEAACRGPRLRTLIDLGANIGVSSRYFAARYPECRIFAVEPFPSNARLLRLNLRDLMAAGRAEVLEDAVWDKDGGLLDSATADAEYNGVQFAEARPGAGAVRGLTLSTILALSGFAQVDLLKVDIEGAEVQLFAGPLDWLDRVRAMAVEFHGDSRRASDFDAIVRHHGFRVAHENWHTVLVSRP